LDLGKIKARADDEKTGKAEKAVTVQPGEENAQGDLIKVSKYLKG